jgi:SsrA-binding protein
MTGKLEILLKNKKIGLNYETLEKLEGGISLYGFEVKSLKNHTGSINESYVSIKDGEAWLLNAHIPGYQPKNTPDGFDSYRPRKLLLSKKQILEWADKVKQSNLTIMPISMYNNSKKIKVSLALARGKKKHDKRLSIKKRDIEKDLGRRLKN